MTGNVSIGAVLANREYRSVWLADIQSTLGDQLARVALSILVFERTGSQLAAAGAYATTFAPAIFGGLLLGHLADKFPRRSILIGCDLLRAGLLLTLLLPVPLWLMYVIAGGVVLAGSPFLAAEPALIADIFDSDIYVTAVGIRATTAQVSYLVGFAGGGLVVAATGPRAAFGLDAITFALSALLISRGVAVRPAARSGPSGVSNSGRSPTRALTLIRRDPRLRSILGFAWLAGLWVVPEGLAVPYASSHGGGSSAAGLLLASIPAGAACGALLVTQAVRPSARGRLVGAMALCTGLPLIACGVGPALPVTMILWALSGAASAYQVVLMAEFVAEVPATSRGGALGVASAGLIGAQGVGLLAGGAAAEAWSTAAAIAAAGALGLALSVYLWVGRRRLQIGSAPTV